MVQVELKLFLLRKMIFKGKWMYENWEMEIIYKKMLILKIDDLFIISMLQR